jgi:Amt family ammonium transporter
MLSFDLNRRLRPLLSTALAAFVLLALLTVSSVRAQDSAGAPGAPAAAPTTVPAPAAAAAPVPDPTGAATGAAADAFGMPTNQDIFTETDAAKQKADIDKIKKTEPYAAGMLDMIGHIKIATNTAWTLNTGYLVLFMQAGFALLTCGLIRKKNAGHLMMLNFAAYVIAFVGYYAVGYAFQFGAIGITPLAPGNLGGTPTLAHWLIPNWIGGTGFFMQGPAYDASVNTLMLFEIVFMETAGYIIVGAICERITFGAFILCEIFMSTILYPIFGCWVWGGGWLSQLKMGHGYVDFAGSTVVHGIGGFAAMALAVILGPRLGKYNKEGKPVAFPAHNIVFVVTGTFILLYGWMGFNPGSTLGATDLRISVVAVNTNLAAVFGAITAMVLWNFMFKKPDISMACNGMLAGLVAITAPCAYVDAKSSCIIGVLAGLVVCAGVLFNERVLKVDDPCGAISVHGYCGFLGGICLGLFADGKYGQGQNGQGITEYMGTKGADLKGVTGLFYGDPKQFLVQVLGAVVMAAWAFGLTFIVFKIVNSVKSMRVSREAELEGLDVPEFGSLAYPEDEYPSSGITSETGMS